MSTKAQDRLKMRVITAMVVGIFAYTVISAFATDEMVARGLSQIFQTK